MIRQLARFASVGIAATLVHVVVALAVREMFQFSAQFANLTGFLTAVGLSYAGHIFFTFRINPVHRLHLPRFFFIALVGLAASSLVTFIVHTRLESSFAMAMAGVAVIVPLLSFFAAKYWVFIEAESGNVRWLPGVLAALLVATGFLSVFLGRYVNHDVAWYLVATRKWLEGAQLYTDLVEVNPPLNFYLTVPAIWLADMFGITDSDGQYWLVALLLIGSLTWVWSLLATDQNQSTAHRLVILVTIGFAVIVPAGMNIAQREHLMMIFLLPCLFGYILMPRPDSGKGAIARTAFATIGLCIKPHFMLFPIAFTLVRIYQSKSLKPVISPSNLVILLAGLGYIGMVLIFHPAYLNTIVPMALHIYKAYSLGAEGVFRTLNPPLIALIGLNLAVLLIGSRRSEGMAFLAAALLAATGSYLLQWTGFSYQILPIYSMIALSSIWVLAQPAARLPLKGVMGAGLIYVLVLGLGSGFYKNWAVAELSDRILSQGPAPRLMVFTTELGISFPLVLETGAVWTSRYPALWLIPGAMNGLGRLDCTVEREECAFLNDLLKTTRKDIVTDFETSDADILIFDQRAYFLDNKDFDFRVFLSLDPRFEKLLANYAIKIQTKRYSVWRRTY